MRKHIRSGAHSFLLLKGERDWIVPCGKEQKRSHFKAV